MLPPSAPPTTEGSSGLGGYRICDIPGLSLDGHLASTAAVDPGNPLPRPNRLAGTGTGSCTKDGVTWVDVTYSFDGADEDALSCVTEPRAGTYSLRGPFAINDGTSTFQTEAMLTITAAYLDTWTRTISADLDLPEVEMRSSFRVFDVLPALRSTDPRVCVGTQDCPVGTPPVQAPDLSPVLTPTDPLPPVATTAFWVQFGVDPSLENGGPLLGTACYQPTIDHLLVSGTFDTIEPVSAAAHQAADEADDDAGDEYADEAQLSPELQEGLSSVEGSLPVEPTPNESGLVLTDEVAQAFSDFLDSLSSSFSSSVVPDATTLPVMGANAAYLITVKYKTAAGSQTIQTVAATGTKTPILVPNANNANIPELIYVTLGLVQQYVLTIERTTSGSIVLPIDVAISWPPADAEQSDVAAMFGFEGLSVGGGAPNKFDLAASITSSRDGEDITSTVSIKPGPTSAALDVVGQYRVTSEQTDLALRMRMPTPAQHLTLVSSRAGGRRLLTYDASISLPEVSLVGTKEGKEFSLRLSNVAPILDFCSDQGGGCLMPWRVYNCATGFARFWRPTYCPIPASSSVKFESRDRLGNHQSTTLSLRTHEVTRDDSGDIVSDKVTTVSNLRASQFAFDRWTGSYPEHHYFDTRLKNLSVAELRNESYDRNGNRGRYFSVGGEFKAESREFTKREHRFKVLGKTLFKYYTYHESGTMYCHGDLLGAGTLSIDMDGVAPWIEEIIAWLICYCHTGLCFVWFK
jgi:hypothetical protein